MTNRLPESGFQNERSEFLRLSPRRQNPIRATVFAVTLRLIEEVGPILDDICASAHSIAAGEHKGNYVYFSAFVKGEFSPSSSTRLPDLFRSSDLAQAWPWSHTNQIGPSYGVGSARLLTRLEQAKPGRLRRVKASVLVHGGCARCIEVAHFKQYANVINRVRLYKAHRDFSIKPDVPAE